MTAAASPTPETSHAAPEKKELLADPIPVAFALFAFALAVYGVRFVNVDIESLLAPHTQLALDYAVLVAGIAEVLAGLLSLIRGVNYPGWVTMIFGTWLLGFYFLLTNGETTANPDSVAWYVWLLIVPVAVMAVPAFKHRHYELMVAFVAIIVLLLLLGFGFHDVQQALNDSTAAGAKGPDPAKLVAKLNSSNAVDVLKVSAYMGFISAAAVWALFARTVIRDA